METAFRRRGGNCLVSISGRITIDSSPDLRILLLQLFQTADCESLTVDFYEVAYVDTSGLAVLLEVLRAARELKKTFHLSGLRDRPRFLLESTRVLRLFDEVARDVPQ
jgi:anti-sigma B factor antagonist